MNEGFAEYSALLTIRDTYGEENFDNRILSKRTAIEGTPPVWGFDRNNINTESAFRTVELILYSKAPVLLYELEKKIGSQNFEEFSKTLLDKDMRTTQFLLKILREMQGQEIQEWFKSLLQNF